jgi:membrane protein DedA with SNARE-associated domain
MTITGSAIWCYILAYLGQKAYRVEPQLLTDPEALVRFIRGQSTWILVVVAVFAALYILSMRLSKPPQKHPSSG